MKRVLIAGGAGYVGSVLIPKLVEAGYQVSVLDLFLYGDVFEVEVEERITVFRGDIRDQNLVSQALKGQDLVIHLACISNDPSFELDPQLGKSINLDCFPMFVDEAKKAGVKRFVYASSSSVYGVKTEPNVTEDLKLEPLTDYSKFKVACEEILLGAQTNDFVCVVIRPATVCGYGPRLRLDVVVNILSCHAYHNGQITIFGGSQLRPNIHIQDMTDLYVQVLSWPDERVAGQIWNAGYENHPVSDLAQMVQSVMGDVDVKVKPSDDLRSYHISSEKLARDTGFVPRFGVEQAVRDLKEAFESGRVPDALNDRRYYNIRTMQAVGLK